MPALRQLGIGFVPYSPLGHGFLTGTIRSIDDLADSDWRKANSRFTGENFERNLCIAEEVQAIAAEAAATPAQVALAWLLAKGDDIAHSRYQARRQGRGERGRRHRRPHRRPDRKARQPSRGRRRPSQRNQMRLLER
jgi:hypothetical protein